MLKGVKLTACVVVVAACPATHAAAQSPPASDPERGSPAGTIYELPLDAARQDAAPRGGSRRDAPARRKSRRSRPSRSSAGQQRPQTTEPAAPARSSPLRSENGFGSSSQVPGVGDGAAEPGPERPTQDTPQDDGPPDTPLPGGSGDTGGGAGPVAGTGTPGSGVEAQEAAVSGAGDPSGLRVGALLVLGLLLAVTVGLAGRRVARRP